jgi:hypothetical protein
MLSELESWGCWEGEIGDDTAVAGPIYIGVEHTAFLGPNKREVLYKSRSGQSVPSGITLVDRDVLSDPSSYGW